MKKIRSSRHRLRLSVFRSNKAIYAQIIDDEKGKTLVAVSEKNLSLKAPESSEKITKTEKARLTGGALAEKAIKKGIKAVVFDRRRYRYHGRVKALAEGARKRGLSF